MHRWRVFPLASLRKIAYVDIHYYTILLFKNHCCIKYHGGLVEASPAMLILLIDPYRLIPSSYPLDASILVCWTRKLYTSVLQLSHPCMHWQNSYDGQSERTAYLKMYLHIWRCTPFCCALFCCVISSASGPRLNIKTVLSTYGDFHVKDKTAVRTSYL